MIDSMAIVCGGLLIEDHAAESYHNVQCAYGTTTMRTIICPASREVNTKVLITSKYCIEMGVLTPSDDNITHLSLTDYVPYYLLLKGS